MQQIKIGRTKTSLVAVAMLIACLGSSVTTAAVQSKSPEVFVQYGPEDAYFAFTATCSDGRKRVIERKTDANAWCAKAVEGFCDDDKEKAAERACSNEFALAAGTVESSQREAEAETEKQAETERIQAEEVVKRQQAAAAASRQEQEKLRFAAAERERELARLAAQAKAREQAKTEALKRAIAVEEKLLSIEQEKLDLRLQEVELQERAVEIKNKLGE